MAYGKLIAGGVAVGVLGGGAAMIVKARRDRERRKKLNKPPAEPQVPGAFVEWKRGGYVGRITKGEANDWLVEISPAAQGSVTQLAMIEPSYALATELVRNWVDGLAGKTPKAPVNPGEFIVYGRTGGLHSIAVGKLAATGTEGFTWIAALTADVTANAAMGSNVWGGLQGGGKFIAAGDNATYAEATAAADASVKAPA